VAAAFARGAADAAAVRRRPPGDARERLFAVMVGATDQVESWRADAVTDPELAHEAPVLGTAQRLPRDGDGMLGPHVVLHALGRLADGRVANRTLCWDDDRAQPDTFCARTTVPGDHFGFEGHFVPYPVLSGAVQLHELLLPCLRRWLGHAFDVVELADMKFLARIGPGDTVTVLLRAVPDKDATDVELRRDEVQCTTGRVSWRRRSGPV
jgi:hypothetical protein